MKVILIFYKFFLRLRYKVTIKNAEILKSNAGKLVLPNHQATVDPQLLYTHAYKYKALVPVVSELYFNNPLLKGIFKSMGAVKVSELMYGSKDKNVLNAIQMSVINALKEGKNVLLYPSGQIAGQGYEKIFNKQSAWSIVNELPDNTKVIGVRISGLWGSMWSRAWIGKSPSFLLTFLKAVFYIFANLLFLVPKRNVTIEFVDITEEAMRESKAGRTFFNLFLEKFYNINGEEKVQFIKHLFFLPKSKRKLPEKIEGSVDDLKNAKENEDVEISEEVYKKIIAIIAKSENVNTSTIHINPHLNFDLGIDSLELVNIITEIENEFKQIAAYEITELKTVADLCRLTILDSKEIEQLKPSLLHLNDIPIKNIEIDADLTIPEAFYKNISKNKNAYFLYDKMLGSTTRKDFMLKANVIAQLLRKEVKSEYVGIMLPALQSTTLLVISVYLAEKKPVMLNWTVGKTVLDHCVKSVGLTHILTAKAFYTKVEEALSDDIKSKCLFFEQKVKELTLGTKLSGLFKYFIKKKPKTKADDIAVILFTSGSESLPKAVPLTHRNIIKDLWGSFSHIDIVSNQVFLSFLPPFHSFGFSILTVFPLISGAKVAYTPDPTDAKEVVKLIKHTQTNVLMTTPTFLKIILNNAKVDDLKTIQMVISGAESLHNSIIEQFKLKTDNKALILEGYGITECSPVLTLNPMHKQKFKSVGKFIKGVEAVITDINSNEILPSGSEGMIMVSGENIFNGYLDANIEKPFVIINDKKYYKTGDLGYIDEEGYLFITGRLKRFIKIGGEMISLPAIESALLEKYGQENEVVLAIEGNDKIEPPIIALFSKINIDINEANAFLREKGFSSLVKIHSFISVDSIPLLGTGKTDYKVLKGRI